jgi:predicted amidophosphoribosyltransferase
MPIKKDSGLQLKLMTDSTEKQCPKCGQQLRFPKNIGGVLMACPSCGNKFSSNFKLGGTKRSERRGILKIIFEMPYETMMRIWRYFKTLQH